MRESRRYLKFFTSNGLLITVPAVLLSAGAFYYQNQQPAVEYRSILFEMPYTESNVQSQIQLTDQAISLLREKNIQQQVGATGSTILVYKTGPLAVKIESSSNNADVNKTNLDKLSNYLQQQFPVTQKGVIVSESRKSSPFLFAAIGTTVGLGLGILLSLIKVYFSLF